MIETPAIGPLRCRLQFPGISATQSNHPSFVRLPDPRGLDSFACDVRRGLRARPKSLPCRYFYDETGSQLFERICELPEYYLTRTEDALLREHAGAMLAVWSQAPVMIELGSGSSSKTRQLIAAALELYGGLHYVPIDVSSTILEESAWALTRAFPSLRVTGFVADYWNAITKLARRTQRPKCFVFLGSSLGNFETSQAIEFLSHLAGSMGDEDRLLLGTDLIKDRRMLDAAYNDSQGVTAQFNLNLLYRINRELGANFDPGQFAHRAIYRPEMERIEMFLVSQVDQRVRIPGAGIDVEFAAGEAVHTENSHKYSPASLRELARRSGFVEEAEWTDSRSFFRIQRWRTRV